MTQRGRGAAKPVAGPRAGGRPRGDLGARRLRLRAVIEPVVASAGYDLEEVSVSRAGRRHIVRVIVDGDGGVSLDAVAEVSRSVSKALDDAEATDGDLVAGEYQLEVSSPGVDRPLTLPRHWRRNVGRLVKVTVKGAGGLPGQRATDQPTGAQPSVDRQVTGRVVEADDERVVFDLDGRQGEWAYPDLGPGRVQVEFSRLDDVADEDLQEIEDIDDEDDVEGEER
ncbi:ribosome maturation factor RimP [Micromonospora sonneratiae]|jgi:ribosome maturation factor RimP|uniref:Ribosome maturation factor RimP n=1 Tax=Micromonospora sonneratiae TaxID=1184706 RepID=A0ABW3YR12_9ACTN